MSEDDYAAGDGSILDGSSSGGKLRKGPRFSWTPAYEATFFRSLCDSVQLGLKDNHSFKQEAWDRAAVALQTQHGAYPNKGHLINKSDNARKKFRLWRGLREDPDFLYNGNTHMVTGTDEAWKRHVEREPLSRSLKGRPFDHEEFMGVLFPDVIGSGGAPKRITKQRRKDTLSGLEDPDASNASVLGMLDEPSFAGPSQPPPPVLNGHIPTPVQVADVPVTVVPVTVVPVPLPPPPQQQQPQRINSTASMSRPSVASANALTPPDENGSHSRKRYMAPDPSQPSFTPDKRRRTTAPNAFVDLSHPAQQVTATSGVNARPPVPPPAAAAANQGLGSGLAPSLGHSAVEDLLMQVAEAVRVARQPRWPEQAMEIFFRDFCDEDMDLQLKIAEKMLTDTSKAVMFCKMTPELRQRWVQRLREAFNRMGLGN